MLNIGWFSTGRGEGSRGLLSFVQERISRGQIDARIQFVFSNRAPGEAEGSDQFFRLVKSYGLSLLTLSSRQFRRARGGTMSQNREEYDRHVIALLEGFQPDICMLAGYMLILGGAMCRRFPFLNLHPALPDGPIGTWQEVTWNLIEERACRTGAMIHLATEDVDRGPLVSYCTASIVGPGFDECWRAIAQQDLAQVKASQGEELELFRRIRQAEYCREPYLIAETLQALAGGKVVVQGGKVLASSGPSQGLCLDQEIDRAMAEDHAK